MAWEWDRAADDAFNRLLGYSQEYLDRIHKGADEYRAMFAARMESAPEAWTDLESDSDYDDAHLAPLSPPPTPKGQGLDTPTFEHSQRLSPPSVSIQNSSVPTRKYRPAATVSERLTRAKVSTASLFYELGNDGKTPQSLSTTSATGALRATPQDRTRQSQRHKHRYQHRIQKRWQRKSQSSVPNPRSPQS